MEDINSLLVRNNGIWNCSLCPYFSKAKSSVKRHVESIHFEESEIQCDLCPKVCPTPNALKCHKYKYHPML